MEKNKSVYDRYSKRKIYCDTIIIPILKALDWITTLIFIFSMRSIPEGEKHRGIYLEAEKTPQMKMHS